MGLEGNFFNHYNGIKCRVLDLFVPSKGIVSGALWLRSMLRADNRLAGAPQQTSPSDNESRFCDLKYDHDHPRSQSVPPRVRPG